MSAGDESTKIVEKKTRTILGYKPYSDPEVPDDSPDPADKTIPRHTPIVLELYS